MSTALEEIPRFLEFRDNGCWAWYGLRKPKNMPIVWADGVRRPVRYLLAREAGMNPYPEQLGTPTCGASRCVNPAHLQPAPPRLKPMAGPNTPATAPEPGETTPEAGE